jgi:hypothetical protein
MRTEIDSYVNAHGMRVKFFDFVHAYCGPNQTKNKIKRLPFKTGASQFNTGHTSYKPKMCFAVIQYNSREDSYDTIAVYEIWEREDGFGTTVYKFDSYEDYLAYEPDDSMPHAFQKEI